MRILAGMAVAGFTMVWGGVLASGVSAQDLSGGTPPVSALPVDQGVVTPTDDSLHGSEFEPDVTTTRAPEPPPTPTRPRVAVAQLTDTERAPTPAPEATEEAVGHGTRLVLQLQSNAQVGALIETPSMTGSFAFDRATLTGVPDAVIGIRLKRLTLGLGLTWTQISQPQQFTDPCSPTGTTRRDLENASTLFGLLPTARYDVLTTPDGRGRMEVGLTPVLLFSSQTREQFMSCSGGSATIQRIDTTDTVLGFDALLGGRYHLWPALSVGVEVGFAYLVFDFDEDPVTGDPPSVRAFTFYSALTLAVELPI